MAAAKEAGGKGFFDWAIGIENGMWEESGGVWVDGAAIAIWNAHDDIDAIQVIWSDVIQIPQGHPTGPDGQWSCYKDPHSVITKGKRSRAAFLADALIAWKLTSIDALQ